MSWRRGQYFLTDRKFVPEIHLFGKKQEHKNRVFHLKRQEESLKKDEPA